MFIQIILTNFGTQNDPKYSLSATLTAGTLPSTININGSFGNSGDAVIFTLDDT